MRDFEAVKLGDAGASFLPERLEIGGVDFVFALNLLDHELRVGHDLELGVAVGERPRENGEEAGVFGEVVGADSEVVGKLGQGVAGGVGDQGTVAGRAGVAAGAAVAVGADPAGGGNGFFGEQRHAGSLEGLAVSIQ